MLSGSFLTVTGQYMLQFSSKFTKKKSNVLKDHLGYDQIMKNYLIQSYSNIN